MTTPNFRFNKKLTKKLIKTITGYDNFKPSVNSIEWNAENGNNIYGLRYYGIFRGTAFFLQRTEPYRYRLVVADGKQSCGFYIIDDIEKFLKVIGIEILDDLEDSSAVRQALEDSIDIPNTGIIIIDEDEVYVYDHENY